MTLEEAIKVLREINYDTIQENVVQATNMAISALEQPPLEEVLGEIKGELKEEITGLDRDLEKDCTIRWVCDVIDRYIGGKEKYG